MIFVNNKKGFSLIEVLVALTIMAGSIIIISNSWSGNFLRIRKSTLYNNLSVLLERKMTEIDAKYRNKPIDTIPEEESGDFGSDYKQYRWTFTTQPFEMPDLSSALTSKDGGADEMVLNILKKMTEFMSDSVLEGTVTVYVKGRKKELKYSITTYFVDFEKPMDIGGGALGN